MMDQSSFAKRDELTSIRSDSFCFFNSTLKENQQRCYSQIEKTFANYPLCGSMIALDMGFGKTALALKFITERMNVISAVSKKKTENISDDLIQSELLLLDEEIEGRPHKRLKKKNFILEKKSFQFQKQCKVVLICLPNTSLKIQWMQEINKFIRWNKAETEKEKQIFFFNLIEDRDPLRIFSEQGRAKMQQYIQKCQQNKKIQKGKVINEEVEDWLDEYEGITEFDEVEKSIEWGKEDFLDTCNEELKIVLCTYGILNSPWSSEYLQALDIFLFVFDEAHLMRNQKSKIHQKVEKLIHCHSQSFRLFLSGTFYYNKIQDLGAISKLLFGDTSVSLTFTCVHKEEELKSQFYQGEIPLWKPSLWTKFSRIYLQTVEKEKSKGRGRPRLTEIPEEEKSKYFAWYQFWLKNFVVRDQDSVNIVFQLNQDFTSSVHNPQSNMFDEINDTLLEKGMDISFSLFTDSSKSAINFSKEKKTEENFSQSLPFYSEIQSNKTERFIETIQQIKSDFIRKDHHLFIHNVYINQTNAFTKKWANYCKQISLMFLNDQYGKESMISLITILQCITNHPTTLIMNRPQLPPLVEKFLSEVYKLETNTTELPQMEEDSIRYGFHPLLAILTRPHEETDKTMAIMDRIFDILKENKTNKILVFSNFANFLELLVHRFSQRAHRERHPAQCRVFYGDTSKKQRQVFLEEFSNTDNPVRVLFLSHKCAGVGINLVAANHVILTEPSYAYAEAQQSIGRANRIGQERDVHAHFFITKNSIELWKMYHPVMKRINQLKWYYSIPTEQIKQENSFLLNFYMGHQKQKAADNNSSTDEKYSHSLRIEEDEKSKVDVFERVVCNEIQHKEAKKASEEFQTIFRSTF